MSGRPVRNWSFYWDYDNRLSAWVAYLLSRSISEGASSSEAWGFDPFLPASRQQNVSGYTVTYSGPFQRTGYINTFVR